VSDFRFRVSGFGFRVSGFGFRVSSFCVLAFGFRVSVSGFGSGFRIEGKWALPVGNVLNKCGPFSKGPNLSRILAEEAQLEN
jgi:hypothetical protein